MSDDYRFVLIVVLLMIVHYMACVMIGGSDRKTIFTQEFMDKNFKEEHENAFAGAKMTPI